MALPAVFATDDFEISDLSLDLLAAACAGGSRGLPGLISRHDKSPTSRNSEVVPCSSQQLNSRCGQNAACP